VPQFLLRFDDPETSDALMAPRLERAIGVIYRPDAERVSHYFRARLPKQFDAVMHIDETHALEALEKWPAADDAKAADVPETYPSGV
jgi:erythromycin esterase-like protein